MEHLTLRARKAPSGVGATSVANDPRASSLKFVADPQAFFDQTERNEYAAFQFDDPGSGATTHRQLPQTGILSKLTIVFEGTLTTADGTGGNTSAGHYPYGLIDELVISANAQNDLISVSGNDLHALRAVRHPGFFAQDTVDVYPGGIGPGNTIAEATADVVLTWEVPISIDDVTLIGALYAQSPAMNLMLKVRQAATANLVVGTGTATAVFDGTFYVQATSFDVPISGSGAEARLIVPDVTRLHGLTAHTGPISSTGNNRAELLRTNGQLDRLLFQLQSDTPDADTTDYFLLADADADELDSVRLEYGAANRPLDYNPAHFLAARNLMDYGDALPQAYYAIDLIADNPARDVVMMAGVTELATVFGINSGVTVGGGAAWRLVQESLYG